jgi:hypothetical protein
MVKEEGGLFPITWLKTMFKELEGGYMFNANMSRRIRVRTAGGVIGD